MESFQLDDDKASLIFNYFESNGIENPIEVPLSTQSITTNMTQNYYTITDISTDSDSSDLASRKAIYGIEDYSFLLQKVPKSSYVQSIMKEIYIPNRSMLQIKGEGRIPFLMRFPKLWETALNRGDSKAQKVLMNEVLTEDCIFQPTVKVTFTGRENVVSYMISVLSSMPDFYAKFSNIKHKDRRTISCILSCYGTIIPLQLEPMNSWKNVFEFVPIDIMDENMKLQKKKYDFLKSQNKTISIERKSFFIVRLNSELQYIEAIMSKGITFKISESPLQF